MNTTTYNGFANYQTWAYRLWMMNEQESYETALSMARAAIANASYERDTDEWSDEQAAQFELEDMLKQQCEENMPELEACVWSDLLRSAVDDINWGEIAKGLIEDVTD